MEIKSSGILIIDKPAGITSAKVVALLKKMTGVRKIGHTGTLDPFATGVLICCLNQATRLARFFLHGNKQYQGTMMLGKETDTLDVTGSVTATAGSVALQPGQIEAVCRGFVGELDQLPPVYSALKHHGVPLYKLARKGSPVQKPPRRVMISKLEVLRTDLPEVAFQVDCSAGTYIRSLCADIGRKLGCGAYLHQLRRTESCGFRIDQAVSVEEAEALASRGMLEKKLISLNDALGSMAGIVVDERVAGKVVNGQPIYDDDLAGERIAPEKEGQLGMFIRIVDLQNRLLAVINAEKKNNTYDYCCVFQP